MKISVVIPNYNGEKLLSKNIPRVISVLNEYASRNNSDIQLVICDDGSKDKSAEILQSLKERRTDGRVGLTIGIREKNGGFSANVNYGVSLATGEVIILLNTDVIPDVGFLDPLISHFEDKKVFAVGCMDKSVEDGKRIVLRGRGIGKWKRGFLEHGKGSLDHDNTLWVSGGSGAFRKEIWDKIGGLTELMNPFYWEDIDLSYRALKSGYTLIFEKKSTVLHEHEAGSIKQNTKPYRVRVISYRNQFYFVWLNITDFSLIISHLFWLPFHIVSSIKGGDTAFLKGFCMALIHIIPVFIRRSSIHRRFITSDRVILSVFAKESPDVD